MAALPPAACTAIGSFLTLTDELALRRVLPGWLLLSKLVLGARQLRRPPARFLQEQRALASLVLRGERLTP